MITVHPHQDDHPDATEEEERKTRTEEEEEKSKEDLIEMKPQFHPQNFILTVHLCQNDHPDATEEEKKYMRIQEENIGMVSKDLNHCKIYALGHINLSSPTRATHPQLLTPPLQVKKTRVKEENKENSVERKNGKLCSSISSENSTHFQLHFPTFMLTVHPHRDHGHPNATEVGSQHRILESQLLTQPSDTTEDEEKETRVGKTSNKNLIGMKERKRRFPTNLENLKHLYPQSYSSNSVIIIHLHRDWKHGYPRAIEATSQQKLPDPQPLTLPSK